jgi:hypothetical protein
MKVIIKYLDNYLNTPGEILCRGEIKECLKKIILEGYKESFYEGIEPAANTIATFYSEGKKLNEARSEWAFVGIYIDVMSYLEDDLTDMVKNLKTDIEERR